MSDAVGTMMVRILLALSIAAAGSASAASIPGDFDGDGAVGAADSLLLQPLYGAASGDALYDTAADLNGDGRIDHLDLALFGAGYGSSGGEIDTTPPAVLVTLNDIPDDQNDLLVVPPEGFQVTIELDSAGSSLLDISTLSITSTQPLGGIPSGGELSALFDVSPIRLLYEVPTGADLATTSHYLTVEIEDVAGNFGSETYGFAVREFGFGAPFGATQVVFLDFGQDRSLGADVDLLEDLREYGLSSTQDPVLETVIRDLVVEEILSRTRALYGQNPDGTPGPDPVNVAFTDSDPGGTHARLCVGGESSLGPLFLGATTLDPENLVPNENTCSGSQLGVFPAAVDDLWGSDASYQAIFGPLDPGLGGTPVGEHPLDPIIFDPDFGSSGVTIEQLDRILTILPALQSFASVIGTIVAHETGHLVGLVAHGPTPGGLFGGSTGALADHNVDTAGVTPIDNWVMNAGNSFSFEEISGSNGQPLPTFRPLSQAYLRDRVALNQQVTGLYPAPSLSQVIPNPAAYAPGENTTAITMEGFDFLATPTVDLLRQGSPTWDPVQNVTWVSEGTLTGTINVFVVIPGLYDVRVTNPDGQAVVLEDHLAVVQQ